MDRGSVVLNWANDTKDHLKDKNRGPVLLQNLLVYQNANILKFSHK